MLAVGSFRGRRARLVLGAELGRGTFGRVHWGRIRTKSGETSDGAVKIQDHTMDARRLSPLEPTSSMLRELAALDALADVPGVPPVLGVTGVPSVTGVPGATGETGVPGATGETDAPHGLSPIPPHSIVVPRYDGDLDRVWGRLAPAEVRRVFVRLLQVLLTAHERGVVHRDVSSSNILVRGPKEGGRVWLADWGAARTGGVCGGAGAGIPLSTCVTALWHRAPEILCGGTNYTTRVDVWSAGVVALRALCDQIAWPIARAHVHNAPDALRALMRVYPLRDWEWAQSLPGYSVIWNSRHTGVTPLRVRIVESLGAARRDPEVARLITCILSALTIDPARRPSALDLLRRLAPGTPRLIAPTPPCLGPVLSVGGARWTPAAHAVLRWAAKLDAPPEIRRVSALRALEFLEVSIGQYRKGSLMERALPLSCVLLADRLECYESKSTGRSPIPQCINRLVADLPRGALSGTHGRYAILQRLETDSATSLAALKLLLSAMCWPPAVRLSPCRLVTACLERFSKIATRKKYIALRADRIVDVALLAYSRGAGSDSATVTSDN